MRTCQLHGVIGTVINFLITHTSVTQKNCFRIICVIISGLIVLRPFFFLVRIGRPLKSTKIRGVPKSEFFECFFGPLASHPFSLIFPPSFPFRPCSLSHHFSPLHLSCFPPFLTPENSDLGTPSDLGTL